MDAPEPVPDSNAAPLEELIKVAGDLDDLTQAILKATPESKPWQRQLLSHLRELERGVQVLRLTISLKRSSDEISDAIESIRRTLRTANTYIASGRADMGTKAAVRFALELGQRLELSVPAATRAA
ncbi:hypothetical protein [Roseateles sp. P5_D6]